VLLVGLKIWMLPTVRWKMDNVSAAQCVVLQLVLVRDGKTEHSIVGFDELGGMKIGGMIEPVMLSAIVTNFLSRPR